MTFKEFLTEAKSAVDKTKDTRTKTELKAAEWLKANGFVKEKKRWDKEDEEWTYTYIDPKRKLEVVFFKAAGSGAENFFISGPNEEYGDPANLAGVKKFIKDFDKGMAPKLESN